MTIRPCGSCGNRFVVSKERWARSARPRLRQLPQGGFALYIGLSRRRTADMASALLFKADGRLVIERRVTPSWVIPAFDEIEYGEPPLVRRTQGHPIEQLALEGREKALTQCVVVTVANRPHRRPDA